MGKVKKLLAFLTIFFIFLIKMVLKLFKNGPLTNALQALVNRTPKLMVSHYSRKSGSMHLLCS